MRTEEGESAGTSIARTGLVGSGGAPVFCGLETGLLENGVMISPGRVAYVHLWLGI